MKRLALIGAGSHSDAVYAVLDHSEYQVVGYFDDKPITTYNDYPVLGTMQDIDNVIASEQIECLFIAIGDNKKRHEVFVNLKEKHYDKFINVISHSALILDTAQIQGKGVFIGHQCFIGAQVQINDNVIINTGATVEHHSIVKKSCNITPGCLINGIVTINEGTYIGSGSIIIQLIKIAPWVFIGAGSVVTKDLEQSNSLYFGTPAKYRGEYKQK